MQAKPHKTIPISLPANEEDKYELYPAFEVPGVIFDRLDDLVESLEGERVLVIDGFEGVCWEDFVQELIRLFSARGKNVKAVDVSSALKTENEIDALIEPFMGDSESIFGRMTSLQLIDLFDRTELKKLQPDANADLNVLYGCGAALAGWNGALAYVDVPKNELQFRMAEGTAFNLGTKRRLDQRESYKRCYFVDWPLLDAYKGGLIAGLDWFIDAQRAEGYTFISGQSFRESLELMSRSCFRVRPWFAPGVWGGKYLRDNIDGLDRNAKNIAWSYELMALENGVIIQHDSVLLEFSFSFLMAYGYKSILGRCAEDFGTEFPIRFDFLDTVEGDNLSIQCHPRPEYIRSRFGMTFTQDETYYILRADSGSNVYLGFQDGVDKAGFAEALNRSMSTGEKLEITEYVQSFPSEKHKLFLIPNGTIHASGSGNLVLEISSAPYIFTFKMYDWVRLDTDGRPRPINIRHGMNNVRFERCGSVVSDSLISKPEIIEETPDLKMEHLPTHEDHFYDVHRLSLKQGGEVEISTDGSCHVLMVVDGDGLNVKCCGKEKHYHYLETFIIPASAGHYSLCNYTDREVMAVKAFVKQCYTL